MSGTRRAPEPGAGPPADRPGGFAWEPERYLRYRDERARPAEVLFARACERLDPARGVHRVLDLGCGAGGLLLAAGEAFPGAALHGVDLSPAMLERARATLPPDLHGRLTLEAADLQDWAAPEGVDLLLSNATLHWLDRRLEVLARWARALAPGGVLAVQVPVSADEPSHVAMRETLRALDRTEPNYGGADDDALLTRLEGRRLEPAADWYGCLAEAGLTVELWETRAWHVLHGDDPVLEWVRGAGLGPVLEALQGARREAFLSAYAARLRELHPRRADGTTLYPFPRRFAVATRPR